MAECVPRKIYYNNGFRLNLPQEMIEQLAWKDQTYVVLEIQNNSLVIRQMKVTD